jgi:phage tail sheath protein FI
MPEYLAPGVYVEEIAFRAQSIEGVSTSTAGFVGVSKDRTLVRDITSFAEFERSAPADSTASLTGSVKGFFDNGGRRCAVAWVPPADPVETALSRLAEDPVSIICSPDENAFSNAAAAMAAHCEERKDRFCILQAPQPVVTHEQHEPSVRSSYAAYYHPWLTLDRAGTRLVPPCGHIAGIYARVDAQRGVWKAPSGEQIHGVAGLSQQVATADADLLVSRGIDPLRIDPSRGIVVWGGRTTSMDPEWKYVNVRRFFIFIEESIEEGLQWVVSEPHGVALWESVRAAIDRFLLGLWRSGALGGQTADEAYFVRCDRTTMTQDDIDNGRLVALVGVAPLRPAEFVIIRITVKSRNGSAAATERTPRHR